MSRNPIPLENSIKMKKMERKKICDNCIEQIEEGAKQKLKMACIDRDLVRKWVTQIK